LLNLNLKHKSPGSGFASNYVKLGHLILFYNDSNTGVEVAVGGIIYHGKTRAGDSNDGGLNFCDVVCEVICLLLCCCVGVKLARKKAGCFCIFGTGGVSMTDLSTSSYIFKSFK
jgi:hypothetical protein